MLVETTNALASYDSQTPTMEYSDPRPLEEIESCLTHLLGPRRLQIFGQDGTVKLVWKKSDDGKMSPGRVDLFLMDGQTRIRAWNDLTSVTLCAPIRVLPRVPG